MILRWSIAVLCLTVSFSYSQEEITEITSPGPSVHQNSPSASALYSDSAASKKISTVSDTTKTISMDKKSNTIPISSIENYSPDKGGLLISCSPESALVFINNSREGHTPFKKWGFLEGNYELSIQKEGFEEFKKNVYLKKGKMNFLALHLKKLSSSADLNSDITVLDSSESCVNDSLSDSINSPQKACLQISCSPESATVFVNKCKVGLTPFKKWGFQEGNYEISIQKEGFEIFTKNVFLKKGKVNFMESHLVNMFGSIRVESKPVGAAVLLNKSKEGSTPLNLTGIEPGYYKLRLELDKFAPAETLITVVKDLNTVVKMKLITQKTMDSLRVVQHRRSQILRRCFFAATSLALAAGGYYMNSRVNDFLNIENNELDNYNKLKPGTSSEVFDAAWKRYTNAVDQTGAEKRDRNILYTFSAIFTACFVISIPF